MWLDNAARACAIPGSQAEVPCPVVFSGFGVGQDARDRYVRAPTARGHRHAEALFELGQMASSKAEKLRTGSSTDVPLVA